METPVKTFHAPITDEYGGQYPQALVAVRDWANYALESGTSIDCEGNYKIESDIDAITYKANYWYSGELKASGKRSRPLLHETEEGFSDVFKVDLEHQQSIGIINGDLDPINKVLHLIRLDITRRFG